MDFRPDSRGGPVPEPSPTAHARTTAEFLRQTFPGRPGNEHKKDAGQRLPLADRLSPGAAKPAGLHGRQMGLNQRPQRIIENRSGHGIPPCTPRVYPSQTTREKTILLDGLSDIAKPQAAFFMRSSCPPPR